ncbi:beta-ketoacyl-[acyl-carrier-protein] synthase family protein [Arenibacter palladensis]|uniref:beta-ketoacyl-[acyl-carrier-protein] synthase family protein n=1 Tax=Arenibacter palladensis TaxID=237373 RepID=UPI0026E2F019|nr:beta-ketoacyl-[acyl-carrier-protein] synthase family protein [Arenibacter palladensis]MDO6601760.1 beta-ketoacyl-[acyl-carrier-protein] synthase family protein [Arenibacter palladensis]
MNRRVVVTGLGICAPNGVGLTNFYESMLNGSSGITFHQELADLGFGCQIAGKPEIREGLKESYFTSLQLRGLNSSGIVYGVMAGSDAWKDAGLEKADKDLPDWDSGIIFGTGILGIDKLRESIHLIDNNNARRLGSNSVMQTMASGISAYLGGILGCGNQVTTNSSACATGTEGVIMGMERIRAGKAERMLVGSCNDSGPYIWGGFDAMRILPSNYNDNPQEASRPMSSSASGFVPGSGAGAMVLESLSSALERGAKIYAEVLGGAINSGGQRGVGSMTAPNSQAVQKCILEALMDAGVDKSEVDVINGHLTATSKDVEEIRNWSEALGRTGVDFPLINATKGLVGHCLAASGSVECVAALLQYREGLVFGNRNCQDLHPEILALVDASRIPLKTISHTPGIMAKASFGFGDVNACVIFNDYKVK